MKKLVLIIIAIVGLNTIGNAQFDEDKYYHIINNNTQQYLSVSKDSLRSGQFIVQAHRDSLKSNKWKLVPKPDGTYYLQNEFTKKYVLVYKGTMRAGAILMQAKTPTHRTYAWKIRRVSSDGEKFKIRNANSNRPIGPYNGRTETGVTVIQDEDRNQKHLYWNIVEAN